MAIIQGYSATAIAQTLNKISNTAILEVQNGGTGRNSFPENSLLLGNGTAAFKSISLSSSAVGFLFYDPSQTNLIISNEVIPLSNGGTNNNSDWVYSNRNKIITYDRTNGKLAPTLKTTNNVGNWRTNDSTTYNSYAYIWEEVSGTTASPGNKKYIIDIRDMSGNYFRFNRHQNDTNSPKEMLVTADTFWLTMARAAANEKILGFAKSQEKPDTTGYEYSIDSATAIANGFHGEPFFYSNNSFTVKSRLDDLDQKTTSNKQYIDNLFLETASIGEQIESINENSNAIEERIATIENLDFSTSIENIKNSIEFLNNDLDTLKEANIESRLDNLETFSTNTIETLDTLPSLNAQLNSLENSQDILSNRIEDIEDLNISDNLSSINSNILTLNSTIGIQEDTLSDIGDRLGTIEDSNLNNRLITIENLNLNDKLGIINTNISRLATQINNVANETDISTLDINEDGEIQFIPKDNTAEPIGDQGGGSVVQGDGQGTETQGTGSNSSNENSSFTPSNTGSENDVLIKTTNGYEWSKCNLNSTTGVLSINHGGTGTTSISSFVSDLMPEFKQNELEDIVIHDQALFLPSNKDFIIINDSSITSVDLPPTLRTGFSFKISNLINTAPTNITINAPTGYNVLFKGRTNSTTAYSLTQYETVNAVYTGNNNWLIY